MNSPYITLGVSRDASPTTIKRAYHRLALAYHPDKNPGDPVAEGKFREVSRAYAVLSDETKRRHYDRTGGDASSWAQGQNFAQDVGEMFEDLFGEVFGRPKRGKSEATSLDIHADVTFAFQEALGGASREIEISREGRCQRCSGTGSQPGSSPQICKACQGAGERRLAQGLFGVRKKCPSCFGRGRLIPHPCQSCEGEGSSLLKTSVKVTCPVGALPDSVLVVKGEGHEAQGQATRGNLIVTLHVGQHGFFVREGSNLQMTLHITVIEAALGGQLDVPAIGKTIRMRIPPGTQHGRIFRLRGQGVPQPKGAPPGDLMVTVAIEVPEALNAEAQAHLEALRGLSLESHYPVVTRMRARIEASPDGPF